MNWTSRDVLLRLALMATLAALFAAPQAFLASTGGALARDAAQLRLWLTFGVTLLSLASILSPHLVIALQGVTSTPLRGFPRTQTPASCWSHNAFSTCTFDYAVTLSFVAIAYWVLFPPASSLSSRRRYRRQLQRFFQQHDRQFTAVCDRLLEEYVGNERLLFARIRGIYRHQIADWGFDARRDRWLIAIGARRDVLLYEVCEEALAEPAAEAEAPVDLAEALAKPPKLRYHAILQRSNRCQRVSSLRFLLDADRSLRLVVAGDDGAVQIWDIATLKLREQHLEHPVTVTAFALRFDLDPHLVAAGDRLGKLSVWQRDTDSVATLAPERRTKILDLDLAPHDKTLLAVGYSTGLVCIVDLVSRCVRHRLEGHSMDAYSVRWRVPSAPGDRPPLLATSSRDRRVHIWRWPSDADANADAAPELWHAWTIPPPKQANALTASDRLWLPVAWSNELLDDRRLRLWSGCHFGNLLLWEWDDATTTPVAPTFTAGGHSRMLFTIANNAAWARVAPARRGRRDPMLLTVSYDRSLRVWRERALEACASVRVEPLEHAMGHGGHVYALHYSAATQRLAAAVGDNMVRVWHVASPQSSFHMDIVWQGVTSNPRSLAWHPTRRDVFAYGLEDGYMALWDAESKVCTPLKLRHASSVDALQWTVHAPAERASRAATSAFGDAVEALAQALQQGASLDAALQQQQQQKQQQTQTQTKTPRPQRAGDATCFLWSRDRNGTINRIDVDSMRYTRVRTQCRSFAWNAATTRLAVGLGNGRVELLQSDNGGVDLVATHTLHEHADDVTAVAWSLPDDDDGDADDDGELLASGGQDGHIVVCGHFGERAAPRADALPPLPGHGRHVVALLNRHRNTVTCLKWAPRGAASSAPRRRVLASGAIDNSVCVWDVGARVCLAVFRTVLGRVQSLEWLSSTVLATGDESQMVAVWDYTGELAARQNAGQPQGDDARDLVASEPESRVVAVSPSAPDARAAAKKKKAAKAKAPKDGLFHPKQSLPVNALSASARWSELVASDELARLAGAGDASLDDLLLASHPSAVDCFLAVEKEQYTQEADWEAVAQLHLAEGRVTEALRILAREGQLSDRWVALAPAAGPDVWRQIADLYALQLQQSGDLKHAANYFLAVGKVEAAVRALAAGSMFREAIALARVRLGPDHALRHELVHQYIEALLQSKKKADAAHVLLSLPLAEATQRALHLLVSTKEPRYVLRAFREWTARGASTFMPMSFFTSVARAALAVEDSDTAVAALDVLLAQSASDAAAEALYRMARCVVQLAHVLRSETLDKWLSAAAAGSADASDAGDLGRLLDGDASSLLRWLVHETKRVVPWRDLESALDDAVCRRRALAMWSQVLRVVVETNGIHDAKYPELRADAAQDRLLDPLLFEFLWGDGDAATSVEVPAPTATRLRVARCVLQAVVELSQDYLVGAVEQLVALLRCSSESAWIRDVATWLFPGGIVDVADVPRVGELGQEVETARRLWEECFLFQIEATTTSVAAHTTLEGANAAASALEKVSQVLDDALGGREPSTHWAAVATRVATAAQSREPSTADGAVACSAAPSAVEPEAEVEAP
ncbi:hypothetical protein P43SY_009185 [Pythium insidiosum]|uniref:Gem-associated protein 5 TPR domain-containing protein n=1 Tax=Pythium insidiosum TaxID=114742 RepID=A0AAD5LS70_PYTIN|nr:hypothetical protein P43SY_009185 [Pythium insidiosum]